MTSMIMMAEMKTGGPINSATLLLQNKAMLSYLIHPASKLLDSNL